jgi:hypothetical protein
VTVPGEGFRVTAGRPTEFRAEAGVKCDAHGVWHFCPDCGTQLFWVGDGGDELDIFAGTLDDASVFEPEPLPDAPAASEESAGPRIRKVNLKLVGVQGVIDHDQEFGGQLQALWDKLCARLDGIEHVSEPRRAIGYWQFVDDSTRVYFAGVQVDGLDGFQWDYAYGLGSWAPGETTFAVFREKNGEEGSVVPQAFRTVGELGYEFDQRFLGEFEVCPLDWMRTGDRPASEYHEVWIPIVERGG